MRFWDNGTKLLVRQKESPLGWRRGKVNEANYCHYGNLTGGRGMRSSQSSRKKVKKEHRWIV